MTLYNEPDSPLFSEGAYAQMPKNQGPSHRRMLFLVFAILLILVTIPRFNRNDLFVSAITSGGNTANLGDARYYIAYTEHFRGDQLSYELDPPFSFRPLVPFLASLLPFEPMTALNVVNVAILLISLWLLMATLEAIGFSPGLIALGLGLFVCSFPTFYYGSIGYIEPGVLCMLFLGMYGIERKRWWIFFLAVILGILTKETIVLLLPVIAVAAITSPNDRPRIALYTLAFFILYVGGTMLIRTNAPGGGSYFWSLDMGIVVMNITRPRTWISFILSTGLPAAIYVIGVFRYGGEQPFRKLFWRYRLYFIGTVTALALFAYSITSAYADGRYMWLSYPFTIPLALSVLRYRGEKGRIDTPAVR